MARIVVALICERDIVAGIKVKQPVEVQAQRIDTSLRVDAIVHVADSTGVEQLEAVFALAGVARHVIAGCQLVGNEVPETFVHTARMERGRAQQLAVLG